MYLSIAVNLNVYVLFVVSIGSATVTCSIWSFKKSTKLLIVVVAGFNVFPLLSFAAFPAICIETVPLQSSYPFAFFVALSNPSSTNVYWCPTIFVSPFIVVFIATDVKEDLFIASTCSPSTNTVISSFVTKSVES